jgi:hypothetical protein
VLTVREYQFRARVAFDPACDSAARGCLSGTRPHCVIEPYHRKYFPALISCDNQPPPPGGPNILVRIALTGPEADVLFAPGQRFAIWADAIVGKTIRGEGLVGYGVISLQGSPPPPRADDRTARRARADPASSAPFMPSAEAPTGGAAESSC